MNKETEVKIRAAMMPHLGDKYGIYEGDHISMQIDWNTSQILSVTNEEICIVFDEPIQFDEQARHQKRT